MLRESPQAQANMRAPLYEEKVVDLIISKANVTVREVSKEELLKEDDLPEGFSDPAAPDEPAAADVQAAEPESLATRPEDEDPDAEKAAPKRKSAAKPRAAKAKPASD